MSAGVRIRDVPGHRLDAIIANAKSAVLPFGAFEDHGDVGPLGTDTYPVEELSERLAARLGGILLPAVEYSYLPLYSRERRGSISIRHEVMVGLIEDITRGVFRQGIPGLVVINGHGANVGIVEAGGERACQDHPDHFLIQINCWEMLPEKLNSDLFPEDGGGGHGGAWELSVAQALVPGSVDISRGRDGAFRYSLGKGVRIHAQSGRGIYDPNWHGYEGAISPASAQKGRTILDASADAIADMVSRFLEHNARSLAEPRKPE